MFQKFLFQKFGIYQFLKNILFFLIKKNILQIIIKQKSNKKNLKSEKLEILWKRINISIPKFSSFFSGTVITTLNPNLRIFSYRVNL